MGLRHSPWSTRWTVQAGVVVLVLGTWIGGALRGSPRIEVVTAAVTSAPVVRRVIATGTLQAVTTVQVGSQVSGNISALDADFNSIVHKGQTIAEIDPALFRAQVNQAAANLMQAQADLVQTRAQLQNAKVALVDAQQKQSRTAALAGRQLETAPIWTPPTSPSIPTGRLWLRRDRRKTQPETGFGRRRRASTRRR